MLYHGTYINGLRVIKANSKSHTMGKKVAYFTEDRCYALVCCRGRESNFVTMGLHADGKQHYYERFPEQLKKMYSGKKGFVYYLKSADNMTHTTGHTWESEADVPVHGCEIITDIYTELLKEEKQGNIVIHRYCEIDASEQKMHANYIKEHLADEGEEMKQFYISHFSALWD